jgi:hypothetical protein
MSDEKTQLSLRDIVDLEAWLDESFRDEVLKNPAGAVAKVAQKYGIDIPAGVNFAVASDSETQYNLVLSANPAGDAPAVSGSEVSGYMDQIAASSGGTTGFWGSTTSSWTCNPAICNIGKKKAAG